MRCTYKFPSDDFYCWRYQVWYNSYDCAYRTKFQTSPGCRDCAQGYHHSADPGGWCRCPCAADIPQQRARPSWWERFTSRVAEFRAFLLLDDDQEVMPVAAEGRQSRPLVNVPRPGSSGGRAAEEPGLATMPGDHAWPGHHVFSPAAREGDRNALDGLNGVRPGAAPRPGTARAVRPSGPGRPVIPAVQVQGVYLPMTPQDRDDTDIISAVRVCGGREARTLWQPARPGARIPCADLHVSYPDATTARSNRPLPAWVQEALGAATVADAMADIMAMSRIRALAAPLPQVKALTAGAA